MVCVQCACNASRQRQRRQTKRSQRHHITLFPSDTHTQTMQTRSSLSPIPAFSRVTRVELQTFHTCIIRLPLERSFKQVPLLFEQRSDPECVALFGSVRIMASSRRSLYVGLGQSHGARVNFWLLAYNIYVLYKRQRIICIIWST